MGTCMICGADVDGFVCDSHEQDVFFDFTGTRPGQLTPGRFYRGSVDGFADFGVFIDIGDRVTGLLHTSELDRRLEGLDWDPGDEVFVQVKNVRDNGNVDLGWSIRQRPEEFRGHLVQTPDGDERPESDGSGEVDRGSNRTVAVGPPDDVGGGAEAGATAVEAPTGPETGIESAGTAEAASEPEEQPDERDRAEAASEPEEQPEERDRAGERFSRTAIATLAEFIGDPVRLEGRVREVRQTSGPTIFEIRDETGVAECAAFESAGVRAYPEVEEGDLVRLDGEVEERRGSVQVETVELTALEGDEAATVADRLEAALAERAVPDDVEPLADHPGIAALGDEIEAFATAIRRAVFEGRPVVLRHSATVDGYLAAAAIERAVVPLVRAEHDGADAEYHYVARRPVRGRVYGMRDALRDVTSMLSAEERHNEAFPLFVFCNAASTEESRDGLELLAVYDAERAVVDAAFPDVSIAGAVDGFISPHLDDAVDGEDLTTTAVAAEIALLVNPDERDALAHLPATSYRADPPAEYTNLAGGAGYDAEVTRRLHEAVAVEAFHRTYDDKRHLIADLVFGDRDLARHASEQYREHVETELRTARPHLDRLEVAGGSIGLLDTAAFTHYREFPPTDVLLAELADDVDDIDVIVGIDEDRLRLWSASPLDVRAVGEAVAEAVPEGGVTVRGGRDGHLEFLSGARDDVIDAVVRAVPVGEL